MNVLFCVLFVCLLGGDLDNEDLDGYDVWKSISNGEASPRTEILHNIDSPSSSDQLGFAYQGIGLRIGDMKLLMGVPNISYFIPPEERNSSQDSKLYWQVLEDVRLVHFRSYQTMWEFDVYLRILLWVGLQEWPRTGTVM